MRIGDIVKKRRQHGPGGDCVSQKMPVGFITHIFDSGVCRVRWVRSNHRWKEEFPIQGLSVIRKTLLDYDWDMMG